VTNSSAIA